MTNQDVKVILQSISDDKKCEFKYKEEESGFFIQAMLYYKLAFKQSDKKYLVPKGFNQKAPNSIEFDKYQKDEYVKYIIKFNDFLPSWILHRLMIVCFKNIKNEQYWFYGFVFSGADGSQALVEIQEESKELILYINKSHISLYYFIRLQIFNIFVSVIDMDIEEFVYFGKEGKSKASLKQLHKYMDSNIQEYMDNDTLEKEKVSNLLEYFPKQILNITDEIIKEVEKKDPKTANKLKKIQTQDNKQKDKKEEMQLIKRFLELVKVAKGIEYFHDLIGKIL
jgi:hypothetical protein